MTMNDMSSAAPPAGNRLHAYVGTYTGPLSKGIYLVSLDLDSGQLENHGVAAETRNPSFLAFHPNGRFLYAVNEADGLGPWTGGTVTAYAVDGTTGALHQLNRQWSGGSGPCFIAADPSGRNVLTANYGSGGAAVLPLLDDGTLGSPSCTMQHHGSSVDPKRQKGPHAHSVNLDPTGRFALVADLGMDKTMVYRYDAQRGLISANDPPAAVAPPGFGPRHLAFHPNGRFAYLVGEMASAVSVLEWDAARGVPTEVQTTSTLPAGFADPNTGAEVLVHPSGRFLYASNRGHDSIAIFSIAEDGRLAPVAHEPTRGGKPRGFGIEPGGRFLVAANQAANNMVAFRIDAQTGRLQQTGALESIGSPICVKFAPRRE